MVNINVTIDVRYAELIAGWIRINAEHEDNEVTRAEILGIAEQIEFKYKILTPK